MNAPVTKAGSISSKFLLGLIVKNTRGEALGEVEEILMDVEKGYITNLILSSKGLLGKKRFAVPWDMFKFDEETQALRLDVDKEFLERIPAYQGD
jgi:sporulation protein YlmC with PRC-barrel domain